MNYKNMEGEIFIPRTTEDMDLDDGEAGKQLTQQEVNARMEEYQKCSSFAREVRESARFGDTELMTQEELDAALISDLEGCELSWHDGMEQDRND